jgi:putative membrane protein insertion efficiency factor
MNGRRGIAARTLLFALRAYQACISPLMPSACKFQPTCSQYAHEAVAQFGARRGMWLALKRLSRCRPFHAGGFDPVPDADEHACEGEAHEAQPPAHTEEFAR